MSWLKCTHIDPKRGVALVKSHRTQRNFPVHISKDIKYLASIGDNLKVVKSPVTGEWLAIDYMAMTSMAVGDEA